MKWVEPTRGTSLRGWPGHCFKSYWWVTLWFIQTANFIKHLLCADSGLGILRSAVLNTNPTLALLEHILLWISIRVFLGKADHLQGSWARSSERMGPCGVRDRGEEGSCCWNMGASLLVEVGFRGCQRRRVKNRPLQDAKGVSRNLWMPRLLCWIAWQMVWPGFYLRALNSAVSGLGQRCCYGNHLRTNQNSFKSRLSAQVLPARLLIRRLHCLRHSCNDWLQDLILSGHLVTFEGTFCHLWVCAPSSFSCVALAAKDALRLQKLKISILGLHTHLSSSQPGKAGKSGVRPRSVSWLLEASGSETIETDKVECEVWGGWVMRE